MGELDLNELDPGVRNFVSFLRINGFDTCDSGDGSKHPEMEEALPYPHVFIMGLDDSDELLMMSEANRLNALLLRSGYQAREGEIEASYDPVSTTTVLMVQDVDDRFIRNWGVTP